MFLDHPLDYAVVFMLGTVLGSFANICIYCLPRRVSIIFPGSHCPAARKHCACGINNLPLLSYVLLAGRCATMAQSTEGLASGLLRQ
jgi:leader peptidase (prepilin peptidase) / N-methyltransferase